MAGTAGVTVVEQPPAQRTDTDRVLRMAAILLLVSIAVDIVLAWRAPRITHVGDALCWYGGRGVSLVAASPLASGRRWARAWVLGWTVGRLAVPAAAAVLIVLMGYLALATGGLAAAGEVLWKGMLFLLPYAPVSTAILFLLARADVRARFRPMTFRDAAIAVLGVVVGYPQL